jgi:hypothetical protein
VLALDAEKARIDALLSGLVTQTAPQLLALHGVGTGHRSRAAGHRR